MRASDEPQHDQRSKALFGWPDASWLFLIAGMALGVAAFLIPAYEAVADARDLRDRAIAVERRRLDRLERYERYLEAIDRREPRLIQTLAATQLSLVPEHAEPIDGADRLFKSGAMVLYELEPPPPAFVERTRPESRLQRLATGEKTRLWVLCAASLLCLLGILPASKSARPSMNEAESNDDDFEDEWDDAYEDD